MENSEINDKTNPLKNGDIIQKGDVYWTHVDAIQWLEVPERMYGVEYNSAEYCPIRRPTEDSHV